MAERNCFYSYHISNRGLTTSTISLNLCQSVTICYNLFSCCLLGGGLALEQQRQRQSHGPLWSPRPPRGRVVVPPSRPPPCSPTRRRGLHISDLVWQLVLAERAEMKETKVRYNKIAKAVLCHPRIQNLKPAIIFVGKFEIFSKPIRSYVPQ